MTLTKKQNNSIVLFRILIGWHFFYEGITKIYNPLWTSEAYLNNATGPFRKGFELLASDSLIGIIDFVNITGLTAIGVLLILGFWERLAAVAGIVLLLFYYLSQPPFPGVNPLGAEGNYFLINKNLIEAAGLLIIYFFPTGKTFGIQRLFHSAKSKTQLN